MTRRILLIDDEQAVLDAFRRTLRKRFDVTTACGPEEGLRVLEEQGPFALVVTDFNMPGMDGVELLKHVESFDADIVRVMLTGQAETSTAIDAINDGHIFRFLTKPCEPHVMAACLDDGLEQWRLRHAERELLEQTVRGSIQVLSDVLALSNPAAFGKASRLVGLVRHVTRTLELAGAWQYETAALLSQLGCVAVPDDLLERLAAGEELLGEQTAIYDRHPEVARKLLGHIPRLRRVAEIVYQQMDGAEPTDDKIVLLGARILAAAIEFEEDISIGATKQQVVESLTRGGHYPHRIVSALASATVAGTAGTERAMPLQELRVGMVLLEDLKTGDGNLIFGRDQVLTAGALERLRNYAELGRLEKTMIRVSVVPEADVSEAA